MKKTLKAIDPHKLYPLEVFYAVTGIGRAGLRAARQRGLSVRYVGRNGYVHGKEWIDFVLRNGRAGK